MVVINKTKSKTLAESAQICFSPLSQAKGLMFSKPLKKNCLVFAFKNERFVMLHMLFVFSPIDILFLNRKNRVVELRENIKPFTPLIKSKKEVKYVIELPKGTIKKTKTRLNDLIQF